MDEDTLARATEPFFTTKGIGKGTGLGLPMVQSLAEQSGGKLVMRSKPGKGTVAQLWLPADRGDEKAAPKKRQAAAPVRSSACLCVLAVDDDALVLSNTAAMLEELGHEVIEASSGKEALRILKDQEVDLLVTDYAMPGMTGDDLVKAVRTERPKLPMVMVSGYAELPKDAASGIPRLAKPFNEAGLAAAITSALATPGAEPSALR